MFSFAKLDALAVLGRELGEDRLDRRHGPHQGAQKSTTTGLSACSTSRLERLVGDLAHRRPSARSGRAAREPQQRHLPDRLEHDRAAHLRAAVLAVDEARSAPRRRGSRRAARGRWSRSGRRSRCDVIASRSIVSSTRAAVALEAAGQVVHGHAEDRPRVERAAGRDRRAATSPSSATPPPGT